MARMIVLTLAAALLATCSAVQPESVVNAGQWASAATASSLNEIVAGLPGIDDHEHVPFTVLTKYIIRPSIAKEFITGWLRFREIVKEAKGARHINLSKPLTDNLVYYSYEEWDCRKDASRFVKNSSAVKELIEYIEDHDIPVQTTQLVPAVPYNKPDHIVASTKLDNINEVAGMSLNSLAEFIHDVQDLVLPTETKEAKVATTGDVLLRDSTRNNTVIILTKFLVKPSRIVQFVKAADLVTKAVAKNEKGNLVYGLSKPLNDDVTFWSYAIWEDEAALKEHLKTVYVKKFLEYILEQDIYIKSTPLLPIEQLDD